MGVATALGAARHVVEVVDALDVEADMLPAFDEGEVAARVVDARQSHKMAAIQADRGEPEVSASRRRNLRPARRPRTLPARGPSTLLPRVRAAFRYPTAPGPLRADQIARRSPRPRRQPLHPGPRTWGPSSDEFAAYCRASPHAIGVANGTDAITIALRALGVGPGDEVVVPSFTFWASAEAVPPTGAVPVFCDVDPDDVPRHARDGQGGDDPRTKAVIAVHLFGNVAPVAEIEALGVPVLEDAAQAAGSRPTAAPGRARHAATFSFYPSKNLGAFGDGGAVITSETPSRRRCARCASTARATRSATFEHVGYNSPPRRAPGGDPARAASAPRRLARRPSGGRRAVRGAGLGGSSAPAGRRGRAPAWHLYVVRHPRADELMAALNAAGVQARAYYRTPMHRQPAMAPYVPRRASPLPVTDALAATNIALPISPVLSAAQAGEVVAALAEAA